MPDIYQAKTSGSTSEFRFSGTAANVFDLVGPDGGQLSVQVDDRKPTTPNRIDGCCTYHRMAKTPVASEIKDGVHHVRIPLTDDQLDKREILFEKNREDFDKSPEKYAGNTWYAGSLLIIGD